MRLSCRLPKLHASSQGWFHFRAVIVSGTGFFTDAYDIFVITQFFFVYLGSTSINQGDDKVDRNVDALLKASTSWGNLVGQLLFGYLGDRLGRKRMYGKELIIMIFCTICTGFAAPGMSPGLSILLVLGISRFFLGIGIGGDYPMSAIITSEFANVRFRGMLIAAVFAMQGMGILVSGFVFVITLSYMRQYIESDILILDWVWRIALWTGVIPGFIALYFRLTIPETPRFTVDVLGDAEKAEQDVIKVLALNEVRDVTSAWVRETATPTARIAVKSDNFFEFISQRRNLCTLVGTAYSWFALDIVWYGLVLNEKSVIHGIFLSGTDSVVDYLVAVAKGQVLVTGLVTFLGFLAAIFLIETLGRKTIQLFGFTALTTIMFLLGAFWGTFSDAVALSLYILALFFFNFGPNTTTFVIPSEVFPTRWRATCHGISAACGKVGAIIGIQAVGVFINPGLGSQDNQDDTTKQSAGNPNVFFVFGAVAMTGILATFLVPETMDKTLEELSQHDDVFIDTGEVVYNA
ncbi:major facilitator superfamily domain-containing protein [Zopfochytrium polystomum]|nr:major facilitator superfamily domain-containing protein [Zopfochytrium polystomum]